MRMRRWLVLTCAGVLLSLGPASAVQPSVLVAAAQYRYLPGDAEVPAPSLAVVEGMALTFANADLLPHTLSSVDRDADGKRLFDTPLLYMGGASEVNGVESLPPGTYVFYCRSHPTSMQGTLIVRPGVAT